jgi:hypothetical protein
MSKVAPPFWGRVFFILREKVMLVSLKGLRKPVSLLSLVATLGVVITASQAQATVVASTDLGTLSSETLTPVSGFPMVTVNMINSAGTTIATLGNCVFQDTGKSDADYGQYIYEEKLTCLAPMGGLFSGMTTEFVPAGFTPGVSKIGWNYSGGVALGGTGTSSDFITSVDANGNLHFTNDIGGIGNDPFPTNDSLTFFYESADAPGYGAYNVEDDTVGEGISYAPVAVPVPAAASMGLVALAGLAGASLLKRRQAAL